MTRDMVNKDLTTFADLENPICHAANAMTAGMDYIHDLLVQNKGLGSIDDNTVDAAGFILHEAYEATDRARDIFFKAFENNRQVAFGKPAAAPVSAATGMALPLADKLDEAAGTVQLLYLAAKSMDDKFQRAAMKEGLFQLLLMLKYAGAEARS